MAFDFKKEYKEFYLPPKKPTIIDIPMMSYLAVLGNGDPNEENGSYQKSIQLLYSIAYTLKMSWRNQHEIDGFFDYVVPPLEGFWWQEGIAGFDPTHKEKLSFISMIRLPDFISEADFEWAKQTAMKKKPMDYSKIKFWRYEEGLCVQCMHIGPYDGEFQTVEKMHDYIKEQGYILDFSENRYHHEIYLSDPRRCKSERMRTVVRHPIRKKD